VRDNFFIIDQGREQAEKSIVMVEKGQVTGYGYIDSGIGYANTEVLKDAVRPVTSSRDAQRIVHWYIKEGKMEKILPF
jgi:hypothetical protein